MFLLKYIDKTYLSTQFKNFADKLTNVFSKKGHTHTKADITDFPSNLATTDNVSLKMDKANPIGTGSIAVGTKEVIASGVNSSAFGLNAKATGDYSHAEGSLTVASGDSSHAEGGVSTASGVNSHAEGGLTVAKGNYSHAEGYQSAANGYCSHASGEHTVANGSHQTTIGKYNKEDATSAFIVGNGSYDLLTSTTTLSNAMSLDWDGNMKLAGDLTNGNGISLDKVNANLTPFTNLLTCNKTLSTGIGNRLYILNFPVNENKQNKITIKAGSQYNATTGLVFSRYGIYSFSANCDSDSAYSNLKVSWLVNASSVQGHTVALVNNNIVITTGNWETCTILLSCHAGSAQVSFTAA